eukprot:TRINITY_DN72527_c0_g1_i1.p1 TRINITY_DN72527_c0_g1~~TRINITY_DN72527_c0_g1_i1.p1  ORF type:complete len:381 (-),score=66.49 TRINITY_DN72527_c0_g1_i1:339-1481(-)
MAQGALQRRHSQAWGRTMDTHIKQDVRAAPVTIGDKELKDAIKEYTEDGHRPITGLWVGDKRVEKKVETPDQAREKMERRRDKLEKKTGKDKALKERELRLLEEAQEQAHHLAHVVESYKEVKKKHKKTAKKHKQSPLEHEDELVSKRAQQIISEIPEAEKLKCDELFKFYDEDNDGCWGSIEFAQRMTDIGLPTNVEEAANLLYFAGVRDVDRITYEDFVAFMPKLTAFRRMIEKDFMRHFQARDKGFGVISTNDLRAILHDLSGPDGMTQGQLDNIVRKADKRREGMCSFPEMIHALFGSKPLLKYEPPVRTLSLLGFLGRLCGFVSDEVDLRPAIIDGSTHGSSNAGSAPPPTLDGSQLGSPQLPTGGSHGAPSLRV